MSVQLRLLIIKNDPLISLARNVHSVIEFGKHYDLFDALDSEAQWSLGITLYDLQDKLLKETPYGKPITYIEASAFLRIVNKYIADLGPRARAAIAYVSAMYQHDLIALYYH